MTEITSIQASVQVLILGTKSFLCFEKDLRFQEKIAETVGVNWEGLAAIIIFYLAVLMVNNWAMLMEKKKQLLYHHLLILAYGYKLL